ncbi:MAG TPA: hypothetical protein PLN91_04650 [Rhodanobacteraceae bacterium]|nr:hypothetical protein [Rhodanobacteraceae bacterium]
MTATLPRVGLFLVLALVMAATRINHFGALPDASWAVFFLAGFYLRGSARWAFPLLMAEAVLVDFAVITASGMDFWSHYCVSPAYGCLVAAYGALWFGGSLVRRHYRGLTPASLGVAAFGLVASVVVCHLLAQGSFYWLSDSIAAPRSLAGWWKNYSDWLLPYLGTAALYVGIAAVLQVMGTLLARHLPAASASASR